MKYRIRWTAGPHKLYRDFADKHFVLRGRKRIDVSDDVAKKWLVAAGFPGEGKNEEEATGSSASGNSDNSVNSV